MGSAARGADERSTRATPRARRLISHAARRRTLPGAHLACTLCMARTAQRVLGRSGRCGGACSRLGSLPAVASRMKRWCTDLRGNRSESRRLRDRSDCARRSRQPRPRKASEARCGAAALHGREGRGRRGGSSGEPHTRARGCLCTPVGPCARAFLRTEAAVARIARGGCSVRPDVDPAPRGSARGWAGQKWVWLLRSICRPLRYVFSSLRLTLL